MQEGEGTPEVEIMRLVQETHALALKNNHILKSMQRAQIVGTILKVLFWFVVLGVPLFFIGPYLSRITSLFSSAAGGGATSTPGTVFGLPSKATIDEAIAKYQAAEGQK